MNGRTSSPDPLPAPRDELRAALEGMLRSAKGMVTYTERALGLLDGRAAVDVRRALDRNHKPE